MAQPFDVTILGCSSALPTAHRHPTAQLINIAERYFLVDCGEGTQMQLRRYHFRIQRINHIFISHLHGDHFFGLVGLLSSMHLLGRQGDLHLYHPPGLREIIEIQMKYSGTALSYPIVYHEHQPTGKHLVFEDALVEVYTFPLSHRIPCNGFYFTEKKRPHSIIREKAVALKVPVSQMANLKKGMDAVTEDGTVIPNDLVTRPPSQPRSYAFCSDTCYDESIIPHIAGVDLLYHEATFTDKFQKRAVETWHSTAREAAAIATQAGAKRLLIGHFSARFTDTRPLLDEAREHFPETAAATDGMTVKIDEQFLVQKNA